MKFGSSKVLILSNIYLLSSKFTHSFMVVGTLILIYSLLPLSEYFWSLLIVAKDNSNIFIKNCFASKAYLILLVTELSIMANIVWILNSRS